MQSRPVKLCLPVIVILMLGVYYSSDHSIRDEVFNATQYVPKQVDLAGHGSTSASAKIQQRSNMSSQSSSSATKPSDSSSTHIDANDQSHRITDHDEKCKEQTSLYFLKVHKAGSTCIQNLFWRFGVTRSLSIMLFKGTGIPYPSRDFLSRRLPDPKLKMFNGRYDILCEHTYFDEVQLNQSMKKDTAYIGILREPLSRLRSILNFFGYPGAHKPDGKNVDLAEHLLSFQSTVPRSSAKLFGFTKDSHPNTFLKEIDSKFKVIALLERLDESLVLMKRKLCWHLKDIIYFPTRKKIYFVGRDDKKERLLMARLRKINEIDYLLYEHFINRHNKEVSQERNDFSGEVKLFMKISDETKEFCADVCQLLGSSVARSASHDVLMEHFRSEVTFPASQWESAFSVSGLDCIMMMMDPEVWRNAQKVTQYPDICTASNPDINLRREYCNEHFAYSFPWEILYEPKKYKTFLFTCY